MLEKNTNSQRRRQSRTSRKITSDEAIDKGDNHTEALELLSNTTEAAKRKRKARSEPKKRGKHEEIDVDLNEDDDDIEVKAPPHDEEEDEDENDEKRPPSRKDDDGDEEEDEDVEEYNRFVNDRRKNNILSKLQSGANQDRRYYRVPDWVWRLTYNGVERALLGVIDYWLGLNRIGRIRARRGFLLVDEEDNAWYVITAKQLVEQIGAKNVWQVRRALDRLESRGFLCRSIYTRKNRTVALCLRLNWSHVEKEVNRAWGSGDS